MTDITYDAAIIGGGHNGLCLAAYLARAGWKVGVFEGRHEEGGAVHTEEATLPGFQHNLHAQYMEYIDYMPFYKDFDLPACGARMIKPEAQVGIAFADGRPPLVIHAPEFEEKTRRSIARFSPRDAETFTTIRRKTLALKEHLAALFYNPPPDESRGEEANQVAGAVLMALWMQLGFKPNEIKKSPKVLIDELFESDEMRTVLYRQCVEWSADLFNGAGINFILSVVFLCGNHHLAIGGSHTLGHAMANACLREGVALRHNSRVVEIETEGEHVKGIRMSDGRRVLARVVASSIDQRTTFTKLLDPGLISPLRRERLKNWVYNQDVLSTLSFALQNPPDYQSARLDPDINKCFYTIVGFENSQAVSESILQAHGGRIPENPGACTWVNTLWDPTQAPAHKHALNGWYFFPRASCLSETEWEEVRAGQNEKFLELYRKYAPNMTRENVLAKHLQTPLDTERKLGMLEGCYSQGKPASAVFGTGRTHQYRTEVEGLYMCGASAGGGGVSAAPGYNAFKIIAKDYGLPEVWKTEDRIY